MDTYYISGNKTFKSEPTYYFALRILVIFQQMQFHQKNKHTF